VTFRFSDYVQLAISLKDDIQALGDQFENQDAKRTNIGLGSSQSRLRTAISRAYYGAFREASSFMLDVDGDRHLSDNARNKADDHQYVIDQFKRKGDALRRGIGEALFDMRKRRNQVDYDLLPQYISPPEVAHVLGSAKLVLDNLETLRLKINERREKQQTRQ